MNVITVLIAVAIGWAIFGTSLRIIRMLATPLPPEPDPDEVVEVSLDYHCRVCGLQLTVTKAQDAAHTAPRHCTEEMAEV